MLSKSRLLFSIVFIAAAGCGGSSDAAETTAAEEASTSSGNENTVTNDNAENHVCHFSTDEVPSEGFVLDLGQEPPRFRRDGTDDVLTLTKHGGPNGATELRNRDAHIWIRLERYTWRGGILYDGPNQSSGVRAYCDGEADPL